MKPRGAATTLLFAVICASACIWTTGGARARSRGRVAGQNSRKRYANLYGPDDFATSPTENLLSSALGGLNFLQKERQTWAMRQPDATPVGGSRYDFIVVGAGTAGATVASRLTEIGQVSLLLIEAGPEETLYMDVPMVAGFLQRIPDIDWAYRTEPSGEYCLGMVNRSCNWPAGKVMGGSSVLNYMIATRGNRRDYDRWAELGNDGWGYDDVLPYFKKLERSRVQVARATRNETSRGRSGPVNVEFAPFDSPLSLAFVEAGLELGYPVVDYNGRRQIGFAKVQSSTANGFRMSSNRAYLYEKRRRNLAVTKASTVHRILIDAATGRAVGVLFVKGDRRIAVYANKEVIVCAGAIGSPKLLMLSGIGPRQHLEDLGVKVIRDAPVGDNLMDHIAYNGLTFLLDQPVSITARKLLDLTKPYLRDYLLQGNGPITIAGGCEAIAFVDVDDPRERDGLPNIELISLSSAPFATPAILDNFGNNREVRAVYSSFAREETWGVLVMILRPRSRGWLRLRSNDPTAKPRIVPNYLSDPEDVRVMIKGIRTALKVSRTSAMRNLGTRFYNATFSACGPYPFDSDDYWECHLRTMTMTIYHYSGTCKMGPRNDATAVVDPTLKVIGVDGLRVGDASIMPEIPSGHTNIPTYMIAEKLSDMIKKEWGYLASH